MSNVDVVFVVGCVLLLLLPQLLLKLPLLAR